MVRMMDRLPMILGVAAIVVITFCLTKLSMSPQETTLNTPACIPTECTPVPCTATQCTSTPCSPVQCTPTSCSPVECLPVPCTSVSSSSSITPLVASGHASFDLGMQANEDLRHDVLGRDPIGNIMWCPMQLYYYITKYDDPNIKTVCEVGFGAGNLAAFLLASRKDTILHSFDISYNPKTIAWFKSKWGDRLITHTGDSRKTVPETSSSVRCDMVHVDGEHSYDAIYSDAKNMKPFAHKNSVVLFDDMQTDSLYAAYDKLAQEGIIEPLECFVSNELEEHKIPEGKRFCRARYKF
ncbi:hypothetical protein PAPYR_8574 [Paratrimastix pyriformis]|uniref:Class I SAM-dependent methyltransferase n=1 Tax=Paratrimastix pyriformis TaxID=342808 RepID=A0ABQ8UD19_9EUKA|nr:hypothetical protein PAPYR_8574 [Paratrimastix pyriformis]